MCAMCGASFRCLSTLVHAGACPEEHLLKHLYPREEEVLLPHWTRTVTQKLSVLHAPFFGILYNIVYCNLGQTFRSIGTVTKEIFWQEEEDPLNPRGGGRLFAIRPLYS